MAFLPHAIQLALVRGQTGQDSDSDSDIGSGSGGNAHASSKTQSTKAAAAVDRSSGSGSSALLAALPQPQNAPTPSGSSVRSKWVLPTAASSWSTSTTVLRAGQQGDVHTPHSRAQVQAEVSGEPSTGMEVAAGAAEEEEEAEADLFGLAASSAVAAAIGGRGASHYSSIAAPSALSMHAASLAGQAQAGARPGPSAPLAHAHTKAHAHTASSGDSAAGDAYASSSGIRATATAAGGSTTTSNSTSIGSRKRQREIEAQLQSGNMAALDRLGDGGNMNVVEALAPAEWDSRQYAQRKADESQVRKKYNASSAQVSAMAAGVTTTHKRKNQITSLAVSAVEIRLKQADGGVAAAASQATKDDTKKQYGW